MKHIEQLETINDSKLTNNSPWTDNQLSELIEVFKNSPNKKYIEFEVRSDNKILRDQKAPSAIEQGSTIRIYREDVYKTISNGNGNFNRVIKQF